MIPYQWWVDIGADYFGLVPSSKSMMINYVQYAHISPYKEKLAHQDEIFGIHKMTTKISCLNLSKLLTYVIEYDKLHIDLLLKFISSS